jgi:DNA invertase Pin-like site-specific DNA recombinase
MIYGYARVSTEGQTTEPQRQALEAAGCIRVYEDTATGSNTERRGLLALLDDLQAGDVLTVWKLDRLGRSLADLLAIVREIENKGAGFRSLTEAIDTTTAGGRFVFHVFGAVGEFARRRGQRLGRRPALNAAQREELAAMLRAGRSVSDVAKVLAVDPATVRRHRAKVAA